MPGDDAREPETVGDVLRAAAARHPHRDAYVQGDRRCTYAELDRAADGFAATLTGLGVEPGDVVCLLLPSSIDFATCYLGALRAGAVTSAVNLRLGPAERASILDRTSPRVTVAGPGVEPPAGAGTVVEARDLAAAYATVPPAWLPALAPTDPATIVWTSGTTGAPKGAVYDHVAMREIARGMGDLTRPGDRRLVVVPFAHVGYMTRMWDELENGTTLVVTVEPWSAEEHLQAIERERVTVATGVPTQWSLLLDHPALPRTDVSSVRVAVIGAATIPPDLVRRMRAAFGCPVITRYTSTEAGLGTGTSLADPDEVVANTVGRPSPVVELRLVDAAGDEVPPGEVGEIRLRSRAMFRGYWHDDALTAATLDDDGSLRTGDLGLVDADGNLRIAGRLKEMYLRGGYNVYPAEVEAVLTSHPHVGRVAVVGYPDPVLGERGAAFVVPAPGTPAGAPTLDALRDWCRERLADYKAPDRLVLLDELPVTSMLKVDKQVLAKLAVEGP